MSDEKGPWYWPKVVWDKAWAGDDMKVTVEKSFDYERHWYLMVQTTTSRSSLLRTYFPHCISSEQHKEIGEILMDLVRAKGVQR